MNKSIMTNIVAIALIIIGYFNQDSGKILTMTGFFALSGGITNWIAIHMLFEKIPFIYGSGIILNKFKEFKQGIKELVMNEFFNEDNIAYFLQQTQDRSKASIQSKIDYEQIFEQLSDAIISSQLGSMLGMFGGKKALEPLKAPVIEKLSEITQQIIEAPDGNLSTTNLDDFREHIETILDNRLQELTPEQVKNIIQDIIKSHLGWLVVWGGFFGGLIGMTVSISNTL